ncbi:Transposon Ty3-G Gag-Pol polyprotein [Cucumis melo var. makuwa]|uniref:Transposon Ty3-G Gag-Pol polyprotein n=1 Tax=Cucumis melo var. makuwa TaxID=1194695 RepID=A0A5D3E0W3_CUCMM|nr:Transposon Ty3-G Gag-Pol polyprotein [Cucumis melo var. makuwa]
MWLPWVEYWYNTTFQRALGVSPFQVLYGRKPPPLLFYGEGSTSNSTLDEQLRERNDVLAALRKHLILAQQQMKQYADRKQRHVEYHVGELVFLKIRPYRQLTIRRKRNEKLSPKYFGPYKIVERIGSVTYKLELPASTSIHPVFHVSQLRKVMGNHEEVRPTIQFLNDQLEWRAHPEEILEYQKNKAGSWEVLIVWKGLPQHEASWEDYDGIRQQYPDFHLEDKVPLEGQSNDRHPPINLNNPGMGMVRGGRYNPLLHTELNMITTANKQRCLSSSYSNYHTFHIMKNQNEVRSFTLCLNVDEAPNG